MASGEKIICPWCGAEMVEHLTFVSGRGRKEYKCPKCSAKSPLEETMEAARAAALRRYTPPIKPMTLEEATGAEDPVWFESTGNVLCVCDCVFTPDMDGGAVEVYMMGRKGYSLLLSRQYGKTWRCWERKPTDEERSAAEWL